MGFRLKRWSVVEFDTRTQLRTDSPAARCFTENGAWRLRERKRERAASAEIPFVYIVSRRAK